MTRLVISSQEILEAFAEQFESFAGPANNFPSIATDSRSCEAGALFVSLELSPIRAYDHARSALAKGALGVLSQHDLRLKDVSAIRVKEVDKAFYALAAIWRRKFSIPVVAVAGNVGKTTTKDLLARIMEGAGWSVLKTEASQNGFQGIPSTLVRIRGGHHVAVVEVGIDEVGAMAKHAAAVAPTIVVVPSLGVEHLTKLHDAETAAREEFELVLWAQRRSATIVLNGDDEYCRRLASKLLRDREYTTYSMTRDTSETQATVRFFGDYTDSKLAVTDVVLKRSVEIMLPLPGSHNAANLLGAITASVLLGISLPDAAKSASAANISSGRSEIRYGRLGTTFLCDYYNASPASVGAAFRTVANLAAKSGGRTLLCLGDMLDLGRYEESLHRALAAEVPPDAILLTFGERMRWTRDELIKLRPEANCMHFESHAEMASYLDTTVRREDVVLIKGSRGMKMENILTFAAALADRAR